MPCHPARARKLLTSGRARVHHLAPFVIRLVDRTAAESEVAGVEIGIDPGSKSTGVSVFSVTPAGRKGLVSFEVQHRGALIHKKMGQRAAYRRGRRSRNLRHRAPRFDNRTRPKGWLGPSLRHRVDSTMSIVARLRRLAPVTAIHQERARFDTQLMADAKISGVEYQQGELAEYEVREYLLAKFNRTCVYCGATNTPLNIDHIRPQGNGGSNRVSNLVIACVPCNDSKDNIDLKVWLVAKYGEAVARPIITRVLAQAKAPLKDAAAINSTHWALYQELRRTGLPVATGSGGRTKWNRSRFGVPKTHSLDAICVGEVDGVVSYPDQVIVAKATGRGSYARTSPDASGFPRCRRTQIKAVHGFQTGDLVRAAVPFGKKAGVHVGRVAVRAAGYFDVSTAVGRVQSISYRYCTILQRSDGWGWSRQPEGVFNAA